MLFVVFVIDICWGITIWFTVCFTWEDGVLGRGGRGGNGGSGGRLGNGIFCWEFELEIGYTMREVVEIPFDVWLV